MPLPPSRKAGLRAGRQMQVELFEIPFAGAPEIPCRERIYAFPTVVRRRDGDVAGQSREARDRWAFFSSLKGLRGGWNRC